MADTRAGGSVAVGPGDTVDDDLDVVAGSVTIHGTVEGDVNVVAGSVRIDGTVTGDVSATAGSVVIGPDATIEGSLQGAGGDVTIAGTVQEHVEVGAGTITLTDGAAIDGDFEYGGTLERASGATISGEVIENQALGFDSPFGLSIPGWIVGVYTFLFGLLAAMILLGLFPKFSTAVAAAATDQPVRTGGIGLMALLATPVAL
ncbi:MAG: bactofilin family protein, partial [Halohasta sp.]